MEANKADWDTLFEPYPFFEAYKNYLQIDITAENDDDLRKWKGWVESRLRQLTLKVKTVFFMLGYFKLFCFCSFILFHFPIYGFLIQLIVCNFRLRGILITCFNATHTRGIFQTDLDFSIAVSLWVCSENKEFQ
jgi:hypothetical protein